jgi:hypothetical protein
MNTETIREREREDRKDHGDMGKIYSFLKEIEKQNLVCKCKSDSWWNKIMCVWERKQLPNANNVCLNFKENTWVSLVDTWE